MCNRTDCYGTTFGPMACSVCRERGMEMRDNGITRSWELRPEGRAWLAARGTSGCATCDDLRDENAALVAEVRRLREALNREHHAWQCAEIRGDDLEEENAALRKQVAALEKANLHAEQTAMVLAEQVGKGNLGKIQDALNYAHYKATEREAIR